MSSSPALRSPEASRWAAWAIVGTLALAAALRLYWIGAASFDVDEGYTMWVARHSPSAIWQLLARLDEHPPLYYVTLHWWRGAAGTGVVAARLWSVLCGVLTVAVVYGLGRIVGGRRLGLLAAFLAALSPGLIRWSQETRQYALEMLAVTLAVAGLAWLLAGRTPRAAGRAAYVAGTAAALWTDYTAALFPLAATAAVAWIGLTRRGRDGGISAREWAWLHAAIGVLCAPELWLIARQMHGGTVLPWYPLNPYAPAAAAAVGLGLVLLGRAAWPDEPRWTAFVTSLWVVPIACLILISLREPVFTKRSYQWTDVPLALALAAGLLRVGRPALRAAALGIVVAVAAAGIAAHYRDDLRGDVLRGWDRAAAYVAARAQPGDAIFFYVPYVQPVFDYYYRRDGRELPEHGVPSDFDAGGTMFPPLRSGDAARIEALATGHARVWVVHGMYPTARAILQVLAARGRLVDEHAVTGALTLYLYRLDRGRGAPAAR